ncbi:TLD-domain-containing protein [Rhizophagus diaphanus]|nr:TLD-domain-containing protein [Rhizophagus diaphanus] [Rhizophagus sp. MUCL 43196]
MDTQIGCAIKASNELVKNLHRDGFDRGCIATFNDYMTPFTNNKASLHRSLNGINNARNDTRLYDSIVDVIQIFRSRGDVSRPWILVVVTDGVDNLSSRSLHKCAQEISSLFTNESNNFLFLVGVGDGVNSERMNEMASAGKFIYIHAKDFFLLELIFLKIANKITTSLSLSLGNLTVGDHSASWAEVQRHRNLSKVAMDYALLIDVSASMNSRVISSNSVTNLNNIITHTTRAIGQIGQSFDSRIINTTNVALLASWIDRKRGNPYNFSDIPFEFKLIYRASRDGFRNDRFHDKCDNKGPTIVVIKVKYSGEIIGGYNPLEWRCDKINEWSTLLPNNHVDQQCKTSKSFIFSLTNQTISRVTLNNDAIIWNRNKGPCFGLQDLCITNNFGKSEQRSYENRIINKTNFEIEEYEVFQVIDKRPRFSICYYIYLWIFMGIFSIFKFIFMGIYWAGYIVYRIIYGIIYWTVIILCCVADRDGKQGVVKMKQEWKLND